jgi:ATP-dependent helicase/nuclease subunit B
MTRKPETLLLLAMGAPERLEAAAAFLEKHSGGEPVILAPTRGAADDLLREALVQGGGDGYFGVSRATLPQAAAEIAAGELARRGLSPVSGLALEALAARTVDLCRDKLTFLAPVEDTPGLPRAVLRTLGELRGAGVSQGMLQACGACGADLASLLGCFEGQLEEAGLCDPPAMYRIAAAVAAGSRLGGRPLLALDLVPSTLAEEELLAALVEASPAVLAVAPLGEEEAEACWSRLLGGAVERRPSVGPSRLARLRRHLFKAATEVAPREDFVGAGLRARPLQGGHGGPPLHQGLPSVDSGVPDDSFELFAAPGEGREAVEVARRILEIGRAGGSFDQIAIGLREPDLYWPLIEEALGRAGIPSFFSQGSRRPDPAGRAFLALLACAAESLSASRFAEYLSLGQIPPLDEEGVLPPLAEVPWVEPRGDQLVLASPAPEIAAPESAAPSGGRTLRTPRRWERWLVDAAVIAGADRWRRRLEGIERELLLQLGDLDDGDADERRRLLEDREDIAGLRRFALPIVETLAGLPRRARWGSWLPALEGLAARVLAVPERVLAVLAELRPMAEVGPVGLEEVRRVLEERLTLLRTPPEGRRWGKVFVCRLDELRGRAFDFVFLPGLADGLFPRKVSEDPLLLDERRQELEAGGGPRLPRTFDLLRRERALLRLAVQAAKGRLVASYPSLDSLAGRARVPSFYALDLLRAAEGELPDLRALEKRAAEASLSLLGWPAPRRAEAAIDDAEFDLATLAELLRAPAGTRRGSARFLLETSAALRRSLRNRFSRWTSTKLGPADGLVAAAGDDGLRAALAEARLGRRPYSPTALEQYAACPLRFAYRAILGLRPRDRIERLERLEQLDPATRGALFHRVQFLLQGRLAHEGLLPLRPGGLAAAEKLLDEVLAAAAAEAADKLAPAIPRVFAGAIERMRRDLRGWLRAIAAADDGFAPLHRELAFGLPGEAAADHDPASRDDSVEIALEGLPFHFHLRGSIDLVEGRGGAGEDGEDLRVTDHKTGKPPEKRYLQIGGGEKLQPILYALAAEQLLERPVASGRLFYCTRRGGYRVLEVRLDEASRKAIGEVLGALDHAIEDAFLPAWPRQDACANCDFLAICGPHEEKRIRRKKGERLKPLDQLRSRP